MGRTVVIIVISMATSLSFSGCLRDEARRKTFRPTGVGSAEHIAAKTRFLELARTGLAKADRREVESIAKSCFIVGDLASNYSSLLETADEKSDFRWRWNMGEAGDGRTLADAITLDVSLGHTPPVIVSVNVYWWES